MSSTDSIIVWSWIRPKTLLQEAPETAGLGFETFRAKETTKDNDPDCSTYSLLYKDVINVTEKFWDEYYTKHPDRHPSKTVWPIVRPAEKTKIQWDYIEGAPDQE